MTKSDCKTESRWSFLRSPKLYQTISIQFWSTSTSSFCFSRVMPRRRLAHVNARSARHVAFQSSPIPPSSTSFSCAQFTPELSTSVLHHFTTFSKGNLPSCMRTISVGSFTLLFRSLFTKAGFIIPAPRDHKRIKTCGPRSLLQTLSANFLCPTSHAVQK